MSVTTAVWVTVSTFRYCRGSGGVPGPVPVTGSQAAASNNGSTQMKPQGNLPPRAVLWWESLETWKQLVLSFPIFAIVTFAFNIGPFYQPLVRSILYGLCEGAGRPGPLVSARGTERTRRKTA